MIATIDRVLAYFADRYQAALTWLFAARRATYGVSVVRIAFGLGLLGFLAANARDRHYLWGDAVRWTTPLRDNGDFGFPFTLFADPVSPAALTWMYLLVALAAVLFTVGWRTRWVAPILLVLWVSLIEANPLYGDQSDNIVRILLLYFCFADLSGRWSLDEKRRHRQIAQYGVPRPLGGLGSPAQNERLRLIGTLLHNLAVVTAGAQICLIYIASAMYKIQGEQWQEGTAIHYPLQLSHYRPWPALNDLLTSNLVLVTVVTYSSVFIQLFFPLMLLRRTTRVIAIVGVAGMHLGIAVFMGLPFFSLFIMAGDAIFIRDSTYRRVLAHLRRRRSGRPPDPATVGRPDSAAVQTPT